MRPFEHVNAESLQEAIGLRTEYGERARLIAGGTDLLGMLKDEILEPYPELLINIKTIGELGGIRKEGPDLSIGSLVTLGELAKGPPVLKHYDLLCQAARSVASPQIRNMATLGGNLLQEVRCWYFRYPKRLGGPIPCLRRGGKECPAARGDNRYHAIMGTRGCLAVCPSDAAVALSVLNARVVLKGRGGERTMGVEDLFGPMGNALDPDEILTRILIPQPPEGSRQIFYKFTLRRPIEFATVSVAVLVREGEGVCEEVRIALGAVAPGPVRAREAEEFLRGRPLEGGIVREAAELALKEARPLRGNAYKVDIAKALIRRALLGKGM